MPPARPHADKRQATEVGYIGEVSLFMVKRSLPLWKTGLSGQARNTTYIMLLVLALNFYPSWTLRQASTIGLRQCSIDLASCLILMWSGKVLDFHHKRWCKSAKDCHSMAAESHNNFAKNIMSAGSITSKAISLARLAFTRQLHCRSVRHGKSKAHAWYESFRVHISIA